MKDCLAKQKLESLSNKQLRGRELFLALKHLEICERCRLKVKLPSKEEIFKRFEETAALKLAFPQKKTD